MKTRHLGLILAAVLATGLVLVPAQSGPEAAPGRLLPTEAGAGLEAGELLIGTRSGLFRLSSPGGKVLPLWKEGELRKILRPGPGNPGWLFLSSRGILHSDDLSRFTERNKGLPFKTYKRVQGGKKVFDREVTDLKDLESDPSGKTLVTCTKDEVYLSRDGGLSWANLGSPSPTTGLKAVALAPMPGTAEPAVWASHPIKGLFARRLVSGAGWVPVTKGLYVLPTMTSPEEVADLVYVPGSDPGIASASATSGNPRANGSLWASNSFQGRLYRAAAGAGEFVQVYDDGKDFGSAESLSPLGDGSVRFVQDGRVMRSSAPKNGGAVTTAIDEGATSLVRAATLQGDTTLSVAWNESGSLTSLSELWLLADSPAIRGEAGGKNAIYLQAGYVVNTVNRAKNFAIIEAKGLNAIVVDLKDDFGRLRFAPRDPLVKSLGRSSNPIDVEALVAEAKTRGVWLVARIPVFKDESLATVAGGKYAVWDSVNKSAWQGWKTVKRDLPLPSSVPPYAAMGVPAPSPPPTSERVPYGERWVDPYSEEVWAYDVAIANEIVARGFDEVQFDYIRFPTDGENLADATYRWRDEGMDRESAIASFLAFARERITAPISIDIYGANGWYRSGARTGQDVELIARYVDVICPMLYPSHFEQGFLAQDPPFERPYRIYRYGSLRNARIARDRVIVRPYVQAFYLNVSYDRSWYGPDYVAREVTGTLDGQNLGMTFWNNVDRYDEVPVFSRGPAGLAIVRPTSPPAPSAALGPAAKPAPSQAAAPPSTAIQPGPEGEVPASQNLLN